LDGQGQVIGITTGIRSTSGGFEGIGFAVPINTAKGVVAEILQRGYVRRPFLGLVGWPLDEDLAEALNLPVDRGILVQRVDPDSAADKAGLRAGTTTVFLRGRFLLIGGDVLLAFDGQDVDTMPALSRLIHEHTIRDQVVLLILRDGRQVETQATLAERPTPDG